MCVAFFVSCSSKVESEFGKSCKVEDFKYERKYFSSDISGGVKFQLDESALKNAGKVVTGSLPFLTEGTSYLTLTGGMEENCNDCILLFVRGEVAGSSGYRAVSGNINVETLNHDSKGRVSFAKGYFSRMVFESIDGSECIVTARLDFVFY
jgi:hypothetical protein